MPTYPGAACVKFDSDQDNGVIKNESSYTVAASPEQIRSFYEGASAQSGWTGQEFQYEVAQGLRRATVEVDTTVETTGTVTRFKLEEK